jgi:hypothetical protein
MSRAARLPVLAVIVLGFSSLLGACQALAGIDDRTYDPGPSKQCKDYCALAKQVCTGTLALYASDDTCYGICKLLLPGSSAEPTGDTVACRANQLLLAQQTNEPGSAALYCPHAGPTTNGTCATNCESYCPLFTAACPTGTEPDDCVGKCAGLEDTGGFDVNSNYYDDTLQCRFVHISAATVDPVEHCPHAALPANGPCLGMDPKTTIPDCDSFCHLEMTECAGDQQQYESLAQCKDVCNALDPGTADDESGNTVACRKYHSYNALLDPVTHCSHTGPGGEGHCGSNALPDTGSTGNCESYCTLLSKACKSDFDATFKDAASCAAACAKLDGAAPNSHYSIAASGDNVQCRLLHVSRAFSDATECAAAEGTAAPCQ